MQKDGLPQQRVCVLVNDEKTVEVFYAGYNGQVYHAWQTTPEGSKIDQGPLALKGAFVPANNVRISGARNHDGRLEIFFVGTDGNIYHVWQVAEPGGGVHGWGMPETLKNQPGIAVTAFYNPTMKRLDAYVLHRNQILHFYQEPGGWAGPFSIYSFNPQDGITYITERLGFLIASS